jgi:X-Pro dipeptidyl-peptidase (S15 family)
MPGGLVRRLVSLMVVGGMLVAAGSAYAGPRAVFKGAVRCATQPDGIRFCGSLVVNGVPVPVRTLATSWDGTAVDVNVALPRVSARHRGPYPLVMLFHGYGGSKFGLGTGGGGIGSVISSMTPWLKAGYATFSMSDRGFGESCGTAASRASVPARECANGFNHLLDTRYEVRDAQYFAGELVDQGLVSPTRIAAVGGSYGGGMSMALAALRNRVMLPTGRLVQWRSPRGRPMSLAAAAPLVPWTDLAYALVPNGSTLDYVADAPYRGRYGVMKDSYVNALYATGCNTPTTFCTTTRPDWDLGAWRARLNRGESYTGSLTARILRQTTTYHSSYAIDHSEPPAPLLIANGWTDDLFPADEALRYYNRTTTQYPRAPVSLVFGDFGHPRAQNKVADTRCSSSTPAGGDSPPVTPSSSNCSPTTRPTAGPPTTSARSRSQICSSVSPPSTAPARRAGWCGSRCPRSCRAVTGSPASSPSHAHPISSRDEPRGSGEGHSGSRRARRARLRHSQQRQGRGRDRRPGARAGVEDRRSEGVDDPGRRGTA